eukprot:scaffold700_cov158-Pinguiococcus_pyrenoidosus.AAC.3
MSSERCPVNPLEFWLENSRPYFGKYLNASVRSNKRSIEQSGTQQRTGDTEAGRGRVADQEASRTEAVIFAQHKALIPAHLHFA